MEEGSGARKVTCAPLGGARCPPGGLPKSSYMGTGMGACGTETGPGSLDGIGGASWLKPACWPCNLTAPRPQAR